MKTKNIALLLSICLLIGSSGCTSENVKTTEDKNDFIETQTTTQTSDSERVDEEPVFDKEEQISYPDSHTINLTSDSASFDGETVSEYDYTWHCDPSTNHDEVKNAPAEYYTGSLPDELPDVYIDHELYYYPEIDESGFKLVNYDGEREYAYYYNDGINDDYIFATLPSLNNSFPTYMMHSEEEASENKVLHITEPGTYILTGTWKGQINIDLGDTDDVFADDSKKVTIVLAGCEIECTVAPGLIFKNVYECNYSWEDSENTDINPDLSSAGATVIIADGTENTITGNNVFRMLKTKYKDEDSEEQIKVQKKMRKTDGALYSYMSMVINGEPENTGVLTVNSGFEGVDSELHLEVAGGKLVINSQDDGMNVNEDHVSVIKFTGGEVEINAALGAEGDGVDSNGYARIDGGYIQINGIRVPDSAIDSEDGIYYISGTISIDGTIEEHESGDVFRETGDRNNAPGGFNPDSGKPNKKPDDRFPGEHQRDDFQDGKFPGEPPEGDFHGDGPNDKPEDMPEPPKFT